VALADALLRVDTPRGPSWYRYNGDGYGEHLDGSPFDGTGRGRLWPLLTGERGHYELAAGREPEARALLRAMMRMSSRTGLIPEQVWDTEAVASRDLSPGAPSGSAMPLVWAHAEFIKLAASLHLGRPVDRPEPVWLRYGGTRPASRRSHWSRRTPIGSILTGQGLRLILERPCLVHWGVDGWQDVRDVNSRPGLLGLHVADLATEQLEAGRWIVFSVQELETGLWIERDRTAVIAPDDAL
jgi:glucoamylase